MVTFLLTVVLTNPYQGIDYNSVNSYEIENEYLEDVIHVTEAETYNDSSIESKDQDEYCELKQKEKEYQNNLNKLYPYIFPTYK
jgi:hypothetical protein